MHPVHLDPQQYSPQQYSVDFLPYPGPCDDGKHLQHFGMAASDSLADLSYTRAFFLVRDFYHSRILSTISGHKIIDPVERETKNAQGT